ncbi:porin family protein [Ekhidna sp.]|uniref:porin family protein n=1 Tax=Ekhidna sp. TaxID=2608089 RepID=UPI00351904E7
MKKVLLTTMLVAIFGFAATAQEGEMRIGGGLALGTKAGVDESGSKAGIGINIGGEYFASDVISIAPSFTYFFPSSVTIFGTEVKTQASSINLDGRYYFGDSDVQLYGLAGIGIGLASAKANGQSDSDSKVGLNLGLGLNYPLGDGMFFNGQAKYNTPFEQLVLNAGIAFNIGG